MYIALETYFMTESVGKAVQIDQWGDYDITSSMVRPPGTRRRGVDPPDGPQVEDVFFVLQKSSLRAMATCSIHVVQAMIQQITQVLGGGYHAALMNFSVKATNKDVSKMMEDTTHEPTRPPRSRRDPAPRCRTPRDSSRELAPKRRISTPKPRRRPRPPAPTSS